MTLGGRPALHRRREHAEIACCRTEAGNVGRRNDVPTVTRLERRVQRSCAVGVPQECAHLGEIGDARDPEAVLRDGGEVVGRERFELGPRLSLEAELAVDDRETPAAMSTAFDVRLHEIGDERRQFLQTPLLAPHAEHLHSEDPRGVQARHRADRPPAPACANCSHSSKRPSNNASIARDETPMYW